MVSTSKILTVSYGTFSCTLEGFDDSFETMKAIAEYFRDLAADDRYFGAEPPTPDAEMLARIAEREIARRVEAREEKGGIVLRAAEAATAAPALADSVAAQPKSEAPQAETDATPEAAAEQSAETAEDTARTDQDADVAEREETEAQAPEAEDPEAVAGAPEAEVDETEVEAEAPEAEAEETEVEAEAPDAEAEETEVEAEAIDADADEAELEAEAPAEITETEGESQADEAIAAALMSVDAPEPAPADDQPQIESADAADDVQTTAEDDAAPFEEVAQASAPEENSIAAKLQRIRAVVSRNAVAPAADYSEDEHADGFDHEHSATLDAVLAEDAQADAPAPVSDDMQAEAYEDEDDDSSLADFLARNDAADTDDDVVALPDTSEDKRTEDVHEATDEAPVAEDEYEDEFAEAQAEETAEDEDEDDVASILDQLAGLSDDDADADDSAAPAPFTLTEDMAADDLNTQAEDEDDALDAILAGLADDEDDQATPELGTTEDDDVYLAGDDAPVSDEADLAEAEGQSLRARVVKMKRADFEAAIAEGMLEESDDDADDWNALDNGELSPEEEAELRAELAEVEAEFDEDDTDALDDEDDTGFDADSIFAEAEDDTPVTHDRRRARDQLDEAASEKDMTRLMAKTISVMDEPESASRRSAIQHLRAAVAATRADKEAGVASEDDTIGDVFREDLASVVRPRRPRAEGSGTSRPTEPVRPAPLKLVAEQRIDAPAAPAAPVRPRRVSMAEMHDTAPERGQAGPDGENFADYVETQGAKDLAEILEAAASYLSFVEGRDQFSRPQLMTRARSVIGDEFSREDGLRSFGQLLRQGKIQKLKGGRFTVSEEIGFQPSERRAG